MPDVVVTEITVSPNQGATLQSVDDKIQVVFPPGVFETETRVHFIKRALPPQQVDPLEFHGPAFGLSAYGPNGLPVTELGNTVTLTIEYGDFEVGAAAGDQLNVYTWSSDFWESLLPCEGCSHSYEPPHFAVVIDHLSEVAVLSGDLPVERWDVYLPVILR